MKPLYWVTLALCIWAILTSARATKLIAGFIPVSDEYYDEYYGIEDEEDCITSTTTSPPPTTPPAPTRAPTRKRQASASERADPKLFKCTKGDKCKLTKGKLNDATHINGHNEKEREKTEIEEFGRSSGPQALILSAFDDAVTTKPQPEDRNEKAKDKDGNVTAEQANVRNVTEIHDDVEVFTVETLGKDDDDEETPEVTKSAGKVDNGSEVEAPLEETTVGKISFKAKYGNEIGIGLGLVLGIGGSVAVTAVVVIWGNLEYKMEKRLEQANHAAVTGHYAVSEAAADEDYHSAAEEEMHVQEVAKAGRNGGDTVEQQDADIVVEQV